MDSGKLAESSCKTSSIQQDHNKELLELINDIPKGASVLDLGCGTGQLAVLLSDQVGSQGNVVAVDPDESRIRVAKVNYGRPNTEFLVADDQSFPGSGYDVVVSAHVIHWISDKKAMFRNVYEKLAKSGKFAFITVNGEKGMKLPAATSNALSQLISPDFEKNVIFKKWMYKDLTQYTELAESLQFKISHSKTVMKCMNWESVDAFLEFWVGVLPGESAKNNIDRQSLEDFKHLHEEELKSEPVNIEQLVMILSK